MFTKEEADTLKDWIWSDDVGYVYDQLKTDERFKGDRGKASDEAERIVELTKKLFRIINQHTR